MSQLATDQKVGFRFTTLRIVTAAVLVALTIVLGVVPGIGFIPLPNVSGSATIEHIPTILGSILEGPVVGVVTGLTFGLLSFTRATIPFFKNPFIAIVPRMLIGITPWLTFAGIKRIPFPNALKAIQLDIASGAAGFVGAATNTVFVLGFIHYLAGVPWVAFVPVIPQAILEALIAMILTIIITRAVYIVRNQFVRAPDTKAREDLPY